MYQLIKTLSSDDIVGYIASSTGISEDDISIESCHVTATISIPDSVVRDQLAEYYGTSRTQIVCDDTAVYIQKTVLRRLVKMISNHENLSAINILEAYAAEQ